MNNPLEDEAFKLLEEELRRRDSMDVLKRAQIEAQEFIQDHAAELGIMTLRKAFEVGYRYGYCDGKNNVKRDKQCQT